MLFSNKIIIDKKTRTRDLKSEFVARIRLIVCVLNNCCQKKINANNKYLKQKKSEKSYTARIN